LDVVDIGVCFQFVLLHEEVVQFVLLIGFGWDEDMWLGCGNTLVGYGICEVDERRTFVLCMSLALVRLNISGWVYCGARVF
jgi:hypothetical protein